jgi:hypothetical protein
MHAARMLCSATSARAEPRGFISSQSWVLCGTPYADFAELPF